MTRESFVFAISSLLFGLLIGWILGTQQAGPGAAAPVAAGQPVAQLPNEPPAPVLDVQRASALERQANAEPNNAEVRVELGNVYFDAERFDLSTSWYEAALKLEPKNINASTDLGVSYYLTNQADRALTQFDYSLSIDPAHAKTLYNVGIVRAFGKEDLAGATTAWERLIEVTPASEEATRARTALQTLRTSHPVTGPPATGGGGGLD
ncbi:MAG: tetratricopeptide repeat protein [Acidobacteria bacterium]|nr:tetratricopeptide repeat protein [Acidobacteriota bacterium]